MRRARGLSIVLFLLAACGSTAVPAPMERRQGASKPAPSVPEPTHAATVVAESERILAVEAAEREARRAEERRAEHAEEHRKAAAEAATEAKAVRREAVEASRRSEPATGSDVVWDRLAACESGASWASTKGRYDGGLQFHPQTWSAHGGREYAPSADRAARGEQIAVAERVRASQGWRAWPACSRRLGLR